MRIWLLAILLAAAVSWPVSAASDNSTAIRRPYVTYYLDSPDYAASVDSALLSARAKLASLLRDTVAYAPDLYLVNDADRFRTLIGGKFPDWGAAAAIPSRGRIVLKSPGAFNVQRPLPELVAHEYSHLALADRLGLYSPPRWLDEGLAMYVSMEWSWSNNLAMSKAAVFRQFVKLSEIELVNRFNAGKAEVAYSQSCVAVKYLIDQYGINSFNVLLDSIAHGAPLDSALMAATGSTMAGFEQEFHEHLLQRYNVMSLFMDTFWFWIILAFVVVIGGFLSFRRRRQVYRRWEEEERFQSTDFDYGDSRKPEQVDEDDDEAWRR